MDDLACKAPCADVFSSLLLADIESACVNALVAVTMQLQVLPALLTVTVRMICSCECVSGAPQEA